MSATTELGLTDLPLGNENEDLLEMEKYYKGLAEFIMKCATPMTIAIQGDWGTGKTSTMNKVDDKLSEQKCHTIMFNTWQFSQFDLGDTLIFALIDLILRDLRKAVEGASDINNTFKDSVIKLSRTSAHVLTSVIRFAWRKAERTAGVEGLTDEVISAVHKDYEKDGEFKDAQRNSVVQELTNLRSNFEEMVKNFCELKKIDRLVIFIDDLDRLEPSRAVEILEALKLFFESEKCVFVLAIDFTIVSQGITKKYGSDLSEKKARSFFDKIIQVPFQLPVAQYDLTSFINKTPDMEKDSELISNIISASVGSVPRSLKRLLNTFQLIKTIHTNEITPEKTLSLLFWICMQTAYGDFNESLDAEDYSTLISNTAKALEKNKDKALSPEWNIESADSARFKSFLSLFESLEKKVRKEVLDETRALAGMTRRGSGAQRGVPIKRLFSVEESKDKLKKRNPGYAKVVEALMSKLEEIDKDAVYEYRGQGATAKQFTVRFRLKEGPNDKDAKRLGFFECQNEKLVFKTKEGKERERLVYAARALEWIHPAEQNNQELHSTQKAPKFIKKEEKIKTGILEMPPLEQDKEIKDMASLLSKMRELYSK